MQDVSQWDPLTNDDLLDICAVVKYIHRISFEASSLDDVMMMTDDDVIIM